MGISLDRISRKTFLWKLTLAICILIINIINENSRFVECEEHSSYQPDETEEELYSELDEDNIINCSGAVLTVTNANQDSVHEVICQTSGMNPLKYRCSDEQIRDFPTCFKCYEFHTLPNSSKSRRISVETPKVDCTSSYYFARTEKEKTLCITRNKTSYNCSGKCFNTTKCINGVLVG